MASDRKPGIHGADHANGVDPIPGLTLGGGGGGVYQTPVVIPILMGSHGDYDGFGWTQVTPDSTVRHGAVRTNFWSGIHTPAVNDHLTHYVTLGPEGSEWGLLCSYKALTDGGTFTVYLASVTETAGVLSDTPPGSYVSMGSVDTYSGTAGDTDVGSFVTDFIIGGADGDLLTAFSAGSIDGGPGTYSLMLKVTGKNASSSGYRCDLTGLAFVRLNAIGFLGGF